MEVIRLADDDTFLPDMLIEGYSSMIWTERYLPFGEFQMKTPLIEETSALLPVDRLISLRDSKEVMIVENQVIDVNADGETELTITGRTFESLLETRYIQALRGSTWKPAQAWAQSAPIQAAAAVWDALVSNITYQALGPNDNSRRRVTDETVVNAVVTNSTNAALLVGSGGSSLGYLSPGPIYPVLTNILDGVLYGLGIRNIRPPTNDGIRVTFDNAGYSYNYSYIDNNAINPSLRFDIYSGVDRTNLVFSYDAGDLETSSYLFSSKGYANCCWVQNIDPRYPNFLVYIDRTSGNLLSNTGVPTGRHRKLTTTDSSEFDSYIGVADFSDFLLNKGIGALMQARRTAVFDTAISLNSPYKYGVDYGLGDMVTVVGQYGFSAQRMVSEYVRTEDAQGERGYPTLVDDNFNRLSILIAQWQGGLG